MDFEFAIPINLTDLQTKQSLTDYCVAEVFPGRILPNKLDELKKELRSFQKDTVIKHFDSLYSVLCDKSVKDKQELHETAWTCVIKCLESLHFLLRGSLEGSNVRDATLRNSLAMAIYLTTEYVELLEGISTKPTTEQVIAASKKKRGKSKALENDNLSLDWNKQRHRAIKCMTQLLSLPIQRLWDPPLVEQNLVNCVGNCCFKLLHNADTVKMKETKEDIFRLLGTLIKRHKYSLSAAIQTMECLKLYEHMASTMAECMAVVTREFGFPKTSQDVLREISSLSSDYLQRDSAAARSYSTFLLELSDMLPDIILPVISILLPFLENDPPSMRNAMLTVLGKLVMNLLTGDNLDQNQKNMREEFIDTLCEHLHDCNGFVRAKALQVLSAMVEARTLPVSRYIEVTELTQGRLLDKLSNVRKYAMQLMITLISHNPYGAKLSEKELISTLESERVKLLELRGKLSSSVTSRSEAAAIITPEENWHAMLPEIKKSVEEYFTEDEDDSAMETDTQAGEKSLDDSVTLESVKEKLISYITQCRPADAVKLLMKSQHDFLGTDIELSTLDEDNDNQMSRVLEKLEELFINQNVPGADDEGGEGQDEQTDDSEAKQFYSKQQIVVKYLEETYRFCTLVQNTMPIVCKLLTSKAATDVVEAIQFVINTVQFGVTDAMHGLATMLKLIWVQDGNIKSAVVQAFRQLYLYSEETGDSREADRVVTSLIALTKVFGSVFGLLTSWEEMVAEFVRSDDITSKVLQLLWQTFTMKLPDTTEEDSKIALRLLAMTARARSAIVTRNLDTLLSEGLGDRAIKDFFMARDVCFALLTLNNTATKPGEPTKATTRLSSDHQLVTGLINILSTGVTDLTQSGWIPLMEQATRVIYTLTETPDVTCGNLIKHIYTTVLGADPDSSGDESAAKQVNFTMLTRFVSLIGQVALCQVTYLEGDILQELKRRRQPSKDQTTDTTSGGDELGQTTSDDIETEVIMKVIEVELLQDKNLLSSFLPLLSHIIINQNSYEDKGLQAAATLAMGKYMLISPAVCRQNLRLYFTVLEKSQYTEVKTNAIIALSDMVFRYPNELEPWTPHLYARLRDECSSVRKCTLMVMTRLILNDMVKVKGQISEIAACLVDSEHQIKQLAAQFFSELANKGRALYNVLLDIVSRLSDSEVGVNEDQFRIISNELFSHVNNDKMSESLMERFVLRFRATTDERQWRDLAFCLARLTYSEKSIKKLTELFSCYADKLADDDIYDNFLSIIEKTTQKLKIKPGSKEMLSELAAKIEVAHNRGVEDTDALENATEAAAALNKTKNGSKGGRKRSQARRRTRQRTVTSDSDEDSDESTCSRRSTSSNVSVSQQPGQRRSTRKGVGAVMKPIDNLLSELEEESDEEVPVSKAFTKSKKSAQKHKKAADSAQSQTDKKKLSFSSSSEGEEVSAEAVFSPAHPRRRSLRAHNK